ncbi:hypothetical protein HNQ91_005337 [Filimonas zeae]|nr:DUF4836 family protein [Filimonas zeae]MDR6342253.1 hypothetical protein [Filimonas zeae]
MKFLKSTFSLSALLMVLLFVSCKKSLPKQLQYIPKDATVVFSVNVKSLNDKLADSKVSVDSLVKSLMAESKTTPEDVKKWDDLKDAGIDWTSDVYGFYESKGSLMAGSSQVMGAVAAVSSSSKLEEYLKKQKPGIAITKAAGGYSEAKLDDDAIIGWNSDVVIITTIKSYNRYSQDETASAAPASGINAQLATLFAQKADASVTSIPAFKNFIKEKGDMLLWVNSSGSLASVPQLAMVPKAAELIKDSYYGGVINFENGKVVASYNSYVGKVMADIIKKHSNGALDMDMVTKYPSSNVTGFGVFTFDPAIITDIVRFLGVEATANQLLAGNGMNFTLEDITKSFKGDFAIIGSDLVTEQKVNPEFPEYPSTEPSVKYLFNGKVGDKAAYDKVLTALASKGLLTKVGTAYVPAMNMGGKVLFVLDEKNIFVASDSVLLSQYKAGTGKAVIADNILSEGKGKSGFAYVDFTKIMSQIPARGSDTFSLNQVKATLKDLIVTSDKFDGNVMKGKFELRTLNEKENSLATFIKMGSAIAANEKAQAAKRQQLTDELDSAATAIDSAAVVVDTAVAAEPVRKP